MSSISVMEYFASGTPVTAPDGSEGIILAALPTSSLNDADASAGLVLSGDLFLHQSVLDLMRASDAPGVAFPLDD